MLHTSYSMLLTREECHVTDEVTTYRVMILSVMSRIETGQKAVNPLASCVNMIAKTLMCAVSGGDESRIDRADYLPSSSHASQKAAGLSNRREFWYRSDARHGQPAYQPTRSRSLELVPGAPTEALQPRRPPVVPRSPLRGRRADRGSGSSSSVGGITAVTGPPVSKPSLSMERVRVPAK